MKKTLLSLLCAVFALASNAQSLGNSLSQDRPPFGEGKYYVAASTSGLNLNWNQCEKWHLGLQAKGGYLFMANWMVTAQLGYDYLKHGANTFEAGAGLRYYIEQNGLYLGAGGSYVHKWHTLDDFQPTVQLGYSFFLNRTVTIEPEIYYNQSLKDNDYSGVGFRIGFGIYFE
mgnify:CR=1 FL=1